MAKKRRDIDIKIRNFDDLNVILQNSFSGIKNDMNDIKGSLSVMQTSVAETRKDLENSKKDFVTVDKINAFKIRLADMNEEVKRLDRIENVLKKIDEKLVDKDKFESERQKTKEKIEELKNQINVVEKVSKGSVTETRLKQLSKEVSAEINDMIKKLETYEKKGGEVADKISEKLRKESDKRIMDLDDRFNTRSASLREEVSSTASQMRDDVKSHIEAEKKESNKKMLKLLDGLNRIREENRKLVSKNSINDALRSINREFDSVKEEVEDLKILRKDIKQVRKDKLNKLSYEQHMKELDVKVNEIQDMLARLKDDVKDNKGLQREIEALKDKVIVLKGKKPAGRFNILTIANIFIALAFVLLGVSLVLYFIDRTGFMNYVIIGAIVFFVIGIVIRIVSVIRE